EGEDGGVDGREVAAERGKAGGDEYEDDGQNLHGRVGLAEPGGAKTPEARDDVDGGRADDDEDVAADDRRRDPEGHGQVSRVRLDERRLGHDRGHREGYEGGDEQELVGDGVEDMAERRGLVDVALTQSVEAV